ncbi:hypothetical protein T23_20090 [Turicibacter faecis]|uniref:Uncharacterized protein n=1 Tax=Turicibacter faecis TaxID=2963365 RepID=A0ABN6ZDI3_9FIRM|nr:hypothetical protein T23_20090 [Turicibacter sp. TC023]
MTSKFPTTLYHPFLRVIPIPRVKSLGSKRTALIPLKGIKLALVKAYDKSNVKVLAFNKVRKI